MRMCHIQQLQAGRLGGEGSVWLWLLFKLLLPPLSTLKLLTVPPQLCFALISNLLPAKTSLTWRGEGTRRDWSKELLADAFHDGIQASLSQRTEQERGERERERGMVKEREVEKEYAVPSSHPAHP
jgi:hypothetical protein